jgi:LuxR family transcriptional regulator, maltose regulon positive regulatory protein
LVATAAPRAAVAEPALVLRVTPPRAPRDLLARQRLHAESPQFRGCWAIVVQAAAGFGKTSLLAQWRIEHLSRGAVVAWLSSQADDNPERFVQGLALAVRVGSGRQTFGHTMLEGAPAPALEGITVWLAEVALSAMDVVLIVEDADRLPGASRETLTYVMHNAPPNLRIVVASRTECDLGVADLTAYGQCAVVGAEMLRFTLEETLALARQRLGQRIDADIAARLHEKTEGWPLGLQLTLSAVARGADPTALINAMAAGVGEVHDRFFDLLVANLRPDDAAFLARIALLDNLHPDLCDALTGSDDAAERLARLARETPILAASEDSEWLRMHSLARDVLRARAPASGADERITLHARASAWLARRGLLDEAAHHALAAGQRDVAYDLAERGLYEGIMRHGHVAKVLEWLAQLPSEELDRRPRLLLAAAWALAVSGQHRAAEEVVGRILAHAGDDAALRCECALILSGGAGLADDPDRFAELHDPWAESPPLTDPLLLHVHANRRAFRALFAGDPASARRCQQQAPRGDFGGSFVHLARWGDFVTGLSYLWEGQVRLTESLLRPALAAAEGDLGRRDPLVCMLAALLAAAVWEQDRPQDAIALLANRLDVLERTGLPDAVYLGYRTAARIAVVEGAEYRALELLGGLRAAGEARNLPRLAIASLAEQVRLHARRFRADTCRNLCERIDNICARDDVPQGRLWRRTVDLFRQMSAASAAFAAQDWSGALEPLARSSELAEAMGLGRVRIEVMGLRAFALDRDGHNAESLLREAMDLAAALGLVRPFAEAHPLLGEWAARVAAQAVPGDGQAGDAWPQRARAPSPREAPAPRMNPSMALTPKERRVLELLARNLSNKEIAMAMQIGEETIKWHLKNVFGKLAASSRKQVVRRAHLLGLLEPGT